MKLFIQLIIPFLLSSHCTIYAQPPNDEGELASQIRRFQEATDSTAAGKACRAVFQVDEDTLMYGEDDGLAMQAAWQMYNREVPERPHFGRSVRVIHSPDAQRFVGFIQGRLKTEVPEWWEQMLESPNLLHATRIRPWLADWENIPPLDVRIGSGLVTLNAAADELSVPDTALYWLSEASDAMKSFTIEGNTVLISDPQNNNHISRIVCLDNESGIERWRNELWGIRKNSVHASSGPPISVHNFASVEFDQDELTVFGASSRSTADRDKSLHCIEANFFVEQFDIKTGVPRCRFATNAWLPEDDSE